MNRRACFLIAALAIPTSVRALTFEGILVEGGSDACQQQSTHWVGSNCSTNGGIIDAHGVDLSSLSCTYVRVEGFDVGVECPILYLLYYASVPAPCPLEVPHLDVLEKTFTWIECWGVPCAQSYDFIRGDVGALATLGGHVDLGQVECRGNDLVHPNTFGARDTSAPPAGHAYFYLARAHGPQIGETAYGFSSSGEERIPSAGDCPRSP